MLRKDEQRMQLFCKMAIGSLLIVILGSTPVLSDNSSAMGVVEGFQASLLDVMKRAKILGVKGRFEALGPIIENRFHQPLMIATASASDPKRRARTSKRLRAVRPCWTSRVPTTPNPLPCRILVWNCVR